MRRTTPTSTPTRPLVVEVDDRLPVRASRPARVRSLPPPPGCREAAAARRLGKLDTHLKAARSDQNTSPNFRARVLSTLPRGELVAKRKSLTDIRVVWDPGSAGGWIFPFSGRETAPQV